MLIRNCNHTRHTTVYTLGPRTRKKNMPLLRTDGRRPALRLTLTCSLLLSTRPTSLQSAGRNTRTRRLSYITAHAAVGLNPTTTTGQYHYQENKASVVQGLHKKKARRLHSTTVDRKHKTRQTVRVMRENSASYSASRQEPGT